MADAARGADVTLIRYQSVRDLARGANLAVLVCSAFARPAPLARQTWKIRVAPGRVQALCDFPTASLEFSIANFAADPRLGGWGNEVGELKSLGSALKRAGIRPWRTEFLFRWADKIVKLGGAAQDT